MYIIVEGMPSSGKTTISHILAKKYNAEYFKCLLPDDDFGNELRLLRDSGKYETEVLLLHAVDLLRNELQVSKILSGGKNIIRDKCFISSLAHILAVKPLMPQEVKHLLIRSYEEIYKHMIVPDAFVFINRTLSSSKEIIQNKDDRSVIDEIILNDESRFEAQKSQLEINAKKYFGDRFIEVSGLDTLENEIKSITERINIK